MGDLPRILNARDIAADLGIPLATAYEYMQAMTRLVLGKHVRVTRKAYEQWLRNREQKPNAKPSPTPRSTGATGPATSGADTPTSEDVASGSRPIAATRKPRSPSGDSSSARPWEQPIASRLKPR